MTPTEMHTLIFPVLNLILFPWRPTDQYMKKVKQVIMILNLYHIVAMTNNLTEAYNSVLIDFVTIVAIYKKIRSPKPTYTIMDFVFHVTLAIHWIVASNYLTGTMYNIVRGLQINTVLMVIWNEIKYTKNKDYVLGIVITLLIFLIIYLIC